jgi:hypothetical protein
MKKALFIVTLFLSANSFAQPIPSQSIENSMLGWMKVYNFKGAKAAMKVDDKVYSIAQLSICDSLVNWMQASYIPRGGLGDVKKMLPCLKPMALIPKHISNSNTTAATRWNLQPIAMSCGAY